MYGYRLLVQYSFIKRELYRKKSCKRDAIITHAQCHLRYGDDSDVEWFMFTFDTDGMI